MKIAVLDDYQNVVKNLECFKLLQEHDVHVLTESYENSELLAQKIEDAEAVVLIRERTRVDDDLLSKLPQLKLISQTGKISNHLDLAACTKAGVGVAEGKGSPIAPAELCWGLIMAASRHIPAYASKLSTNQWQDSGILGLGRTLHGLTLGIWGYGKIGKKIAQFAKAFDMNVLVWGSEISRNMAVEHGFSASQSKQHFFSATDILSLHLRLNEVTRGCVNKLDLALMKPDSLFVNISRAELVENGALYQTLKAEPGKTAALDVFDSEPASSSTEPLLCLENVLSTPHIGYVEKNSYELYFKIAFENILAYTRGDLSSVIN